MDFSSDELKEFEADLRQRGYRWHSGHYKSEAYGWWKSGVDYIDPDGDREVGYQVAFLVYNFTEIRPPETCFGIQCEFLLGSRHNRGRVDLTVSDDDMTVEKFEQLCDRFYAFISDDPKVN